MQIRAVDHGTRIDLLDFALFDASPSEDSINAWRRKLERCDTDQELMKIAMLAQHGTGRDWLWSYISERIHARAPIDKARSMVLLGFFDSQEAFTLLQRLPQSQLDTWPGKLAKTAKRRWDSNRWAKYWFNRFLTAGEDIAAWASYRLLLRCIDSRFWFWREQVGTVAGNVNIDSRRKVFLQNNLENIRNTIRSNEKDMAERFLGQKIMKRQIWPWM